MKRLSLAKIEAARGQLLEGKSFKEVQKSIGISHGALSKIYQDIKENIPIPKPGPPSIASKSTKRYIARLYDTDKLTSLSEGQSLIKSIEGVHVHTETVRKYLKQEGLKGYVKRKKPLLTADQIAARYQFAKNHIDWTLDQWRTVMFSDEAMFCRVGTCGKQYYYKRPQRKTLEDHQTTPTKQGGGGKILVWGCMTYYGLGDSCWFPGKINSENYVKEILEEYLVANRDYYDMDPKSFIFQHDNSSVHTAHIVKSYFTRNKIKVMEWPANSPDLNPIEQVWMYIGRQLEKYKEPPTTTDDLWKRVEDIWVNIPIDFIHTLYESMPKRMEMLLRAKGGHIKY